MPHRSSSASLSRSVAMRSRRTASDLPARSRKEVAWVRLEGEHAGRQTAAMARLVGQAGPAWPGGRGARRRSCRSSGRRAALLVCDGRIRGSTCMAARLSAWINAWIGVDQWRVSGIICESQDAQASAALLDAIRKSSRASTSADGRAGARGGSPGHVRNRVRMELHQVATATRCLRRPRSCRVRLPSETMARTISVSLVPATRMPLHERLRSILRLSIGNADSVRRATSSRCRSRRSRAQHPGAAADSSWPRSRRLEALHQDVLRQLERQQVRFEKPLSFAARARRAANSAECARSAPETLTCSLSSRSRFGRAACQTAHLRACAWSSMWFGQFDDQAGFLGHGNEGRRCEIAPRVGWLPARQGLEAVQAPAADIEKRLVGDVDFAPAGDRHAQVGLQAARDACHFGVQQRCRTGCSAPCRCRLGAVHRGVGVAQQFLRRAA